MSNESGDTAKIRLLCSIINYDGINIVLNSSRKSTIRYLKRRLQKDISVFEIDDPSGNRSFEQSDNIITITNNGLSVSDEGDSSITIKGSFSTYGFIYKAELSKLDN